MSWTADSTVITADMMGPTADGWQPTVQTGDNYAGGAGRGRMIRKFRKRREEEEEPIPVIGSTPVAAPPPLPPTIPPQPGLMASMPRVRAELRKRIEPDEDEDEIALLLELIS